MRRICLFIGAMALAATTGCKDDAAQAPSKQPVKTRFEVGAMSTTLVVPTGFRVEEVTAVNAADRHVRLASDEVRLVLRPVEQCAPAPADARVVRQQETPGGVVTHYQRQRNGSLDDVVIACVQLGDVAAACELEQGGGAPAAAVAFEVCGTLGR